MIVQPEDMTVAVLVTTRPSAARVLYRHGIEFCAGASRPIREACGEAGVEVGTLLGEIAREEASGSDVPVRWLDRPLGELIAHIREAFHDVERAEMSRLQGLLDADPVKDRKDRGAVGAAFAEFRQDLLEHMMKEESVLFPWLQSGRGELARTPIQAMMLEHEATLHALNELRELTRVLRGADSSPATQSICAAMAQLDWDIRQHMHFENNILFARALRGENGEPAGGIEQGE